MCGQQEEAGERERSDGKSRDHKASSQPETADDIGGGNQQRDEGSDRSRIGGLEDGECRQAEGGECDRHREVAPRLHARLAQEPGQAGRGSDEHDDGPDRARTRRKDVGQAIADRPENSPQDQMRGGAAIAAQGRAAALRALDRRERLGRFVGRNGHFETSPHSSRILYLTEYSGASTFFSSPAPVAAARAPVPPLPSRVRRQSPPDHLETRNPCPNFSARRGSNGVALSRRDARGLLVSKLSVSAGPPWNMRGTISSDGRVIEWSNGTRWSKQ